MPQVFPTVSPPSISNQIQHLANRSTTGVIVNSDLDVYGNPSELGFYGAPPVTQPVVSGGLAGGQAGTVVNSYLLTASPSAVAANTTAEQTFTVTGIAGTTSLIVVNKPTSQAGLGVAGVRASAANQIAITFSNDTAGSITPTASEVYQVIEIQPGDGMTFTAALTPAAVPANTTSEQVFTVPTAAVAIGTVLVVNKPTAQAGLGVSNARVSGLNQVSVTFFNNTAGSITPTAGETYKFADIANLGASSNMLVLGVNVGTLSSVGANTTAEQTVAVSGLLASDVIVGVSKPTAQAGLGIVGQRVSSAGNIGITFSNNTGSGIVPTASEVYKVTVFRANPVAPAVEYNAPLTPGSVAANTTAEQTFTVSGLVASTAVAVSKPSSQGGLALVGYRISGANTLALNFQNDTANTLTPPAETYAVVNFQQAGLAGGVTQGVVQSSGAGESLVAALTALGLIAS